jgi:prepilin-type N-terminal cleavage/methylation domain-containing protein
MTRGQKGFTLVELMVVVAIIAILASVAIPGYMQNAKKAKTAEASIQLRKLYIAARTYILENGVKRAQVTPIPPQFPEPIALSPASSCCLLGAGGKCPPDPNTWKVSTWTALYFSMDEPHYYRYRFDSTGSAAPGPGSAFTAGAHGDLDCNGVYSTFEMVGIWSSIDNDVHGSAGIFQDNPTE